MKLYVAQVVEDTQAEGPGRRLAVWLQGCTLRCAGCCNPEMFAADKGGAWHGVEDLVARLGEAEGISVLGGEPFQQAEGLAALVKAVRAAGRSVMIYTGYTLAELRALASPHVEAALACTDVLVDGRYDATNPDTRRRWVGSTNQAVHFFSARYTAGDARFTQPNTVELRFSATGLTINGWPGAADAFRTR